MRVLIINGNVYGGGASEIARSLYSAERECGIDVFFAAGWGEKNKMDIMLSAEAFL